jgi:hypothetical protein
MAMAYWHRDCCVLRTLMTKAISSVLGPCVVALLAGCGGNGEPPKTPDDTPVASAVTAAPAAPVANPDAAAATSMMAPPADSPRRAPSTNETATAGPRPSDSSAISLADESILPITHLANQGELEGANKAKGPVLTKLATAMAKDHPAADRTGVAPR